MSVDEPDRLRQRWIQLTYTSTDTDAAAGGWQVLQKSADFTDDEETRARAVIPGRIVLDPPPPRYPAQDEINALPRRLAYCPGEDGAGVFVHSVAAGFDATGRPDNVFSHVGIDRDLSAALATDGGLRPIEWWGSTDWLRPWGPPEVAACRFEDGPDVRAGSDISRDTVLAFLFEPEHDRHNQLPGVLNAVADALDGGRRVVLATDSDYDGARWIALVSLLMAPSACATLSFSTYERVEDLLAGGSPALLSTVPADNLHAAVAHGSQIVTVRPELVFLDLSAAAGEEPLDRPAPLSLWSELVADLYNQGRQVLDGCLSHMDRIGRDARGIGDCPWWPLALAALLCHDITEPSHAAARIVLDETHPDLPFYPDEQPALRDRLPAAADMPGTAGSWDLVTGYGRQDGHHPYLLAVLKGHYLELALSDHEWLTDRRPPPAPDEPPVADRNDIAERAIVQLQDAAATFDSWLLVALRAIDLIVRSGDDLGELTDQPGSPIPELMRVIGRRWRLPGAPPQLLLAGPVDERTLALIGRSIDGDA